MPSGVVYEHVEPTVTLDGYFNGFGNLRGYRNVCFDEQASPPSSLMSLTVLMPGPSVLVATTTLQPSRAKTSAQPRPIPRPEPVITATLSSSLALFDLP